MEKNKRIIIVAGVIALVAIIAIILFFTLKGNNENGQASKLNAYYERLKDTSTYSFSVSLDDKNNISYQKQSNKAYVNTNYQGINSKYIIRDGNTYLIRDNDKVYYTYSNNETELYMIEMILEDIKDNKVKTRFYFKNNDLVYIKTIIDENTQQLIKVDYSKKVDSNLIEIPSDYEEM